MNPVLFRPLIHYVLDACLAVPHRSLSLIVGHGEQDLRDACRAYPDVRYFRQDIQAGTAHAVRAAESLFGPETGSVLVLNGDGMLIEPETLTAMISRHDEAGASATVGTAMLDDPSGYGRIISRGEEIEAIREEADCTPEERGIREINSGIYCFDARSLLEALGRVDARNAKGEYYLTDTVKVLRQSGRKVVKFRFEDSTQALGINDLAELARAESILRERINRRWMRSGVSLQNPDTTIIDSRCQIGKDVRIEADAVLVNSVLEPGARIEGHCRITDSEIGAGAMIRQGCVVDGSRIGRRCEVGPYARVRGGCHLDDDVLIGNFVELKNATIGSRTKALHLSFIGDAQVGKNVNIGCGFITCNSDGGPVKQRTVIEDDVFIGSASQAIAPVRLGAGSFIATGTSVTDDVPPDSFVISRGRQITKPGYAKKYRRIRRAGVERLVEQEQQAGRPPAK